MDVETEKSSYAAVAGSGPAPAAVPERQDSLAAAAADLAALKRQAVPPHVQMRQAAGSWPGAKPRAVAGEDAGEPKAKRRRRGEAAAGETLASKPYTPNPDPGQQTLNP